jgi:hypothetical protein
MQIFINVLNASGCLFVAIVNDTFSTLKAIQNLIVAPSSREDFHANKFSEFTTMMKHTGEMTRHS